MFRRLRAGDRDAAAEDETRHAVDPGLLGGFGFAFDALDVGVAGQALAHQVAVHAAIDGGLDQHIGIAEVGALGEIKIHEPLLHAPRIGDAVRPRDDAVAIERVRLPRDFVGRIGQALRGGRGGDALRDGGVALDGTEFRFQIGLAVDAFARNPRVEEIGPPVDVDFDAGIELGRGFQPAFADIAPRTDDVGNDVGAHRNRGVRFNAHGRKPSFV